MQKAEGSTRRKDWSGGEAMVWCTFCTMDRRRPFCPSRHFWWWMNVFFFCRFTRSKLKVESLSKLGSLLYYLDQTQDMSFDRSLQWCYNTARQTNKVGAKKAPICTSCGAVSGRERQRIAQMQEIPFPLVKWLANTSPWGKVIGCVREWEKVNRANARNTMIPAREMTGKYFSVRESHQWFAVSLYVSMGGASPVW